MDLQNATEGFEYSKASPDFKVSLVHGKLKAAEKDKQMQLFVSGQTYHGRHNSD